MLALEPIAAGVKALCGMMLNVPVGEPVVQDRSIPDCESHVS